MRVTLFFGEAEVVETVDEEEDGEEENEAN